MSFLQNFIDADITEATLSRELITGYVRQLFKRWDFPDQMFVSLGNSSVVSKGDLVWANIDCESPHDWVPLPRIDELVFRALEKRPERRPQSAVEVKTHVETIATTSAPLPAPQSSFSPQTGKCASSLTGTTWQFTSTVRGSLMLRWR